MPASANRLQSSRPHGRDQVRAALLEAARGLFAERGTAAVSIRDIAAAAGVNHGLVHRHFGSKRALLRAALASGEPDGPHPTGPTGHPLLPRELLEAAVERDPQLRTLARAILDGELPENLAAELPGVERLVETFVELGRSGRLAPEFDPRLVAAATLALALGWMLFEPVVVAATGLADATHTDNRARLQELILRLVGRMSGAEGNDGGP